MKITDKNMLNAIKCALFDVAKEEQQKKKNNKC